MKKTYTIRIVVTVEAHTKLTKEVQIEATSKPEARRIAQTTYGGKVMN